MSKGRTDVIVGILGQWASGKSTAAEILVDHLGGKDEVVFLTDRPLMAGQALERILECDEDKIKRSIVEDGLQRIEGGVAIVFLRPGEELDSVDLNTLLFDLHKDVYDTVPPGSYNWMDKARFELGQQIREKSQGEKPIVVEAGFGSNTEPRGENPFSQTIADLFDRLDEAGVGPTLVKWIIIGASYDIRSKRNLARTDSVPAYEFDRFAADGGDLDANHEDRLIEQGVALMRVSNEHDDIDKYEADIIGAFQTLYGS